MKTLTNYFQNALTVSLSPISITPPQTMVAESGDPLVTEAGTHVTLEN